MCNNGNKTIHSKEAQKKFGSDGRNRKLEYISTKNIKSEKKKKRM